MGVRTKFDQMSNLSLGPYCKGVSKRGLDHYFFPKNGNENQEILNRTGMFVSGFAIEEGGMGWK